METAPCIDANLPAGYTVARIELLGGRFVSWALFRNGLMISNYVSLSAASSAAFEHFRMLH